MTPEPQRPAPRATRAALADATVRDPRWARVQARDPGADAAFVYSVRTTGVYCRPSCAARTPRPENVVFHATTAADARRAGFRACLRCQPDGASLAARQAALVADLCRLLAGAETAPNLDQLARHGKVSRYRLHRGFEALQEIPPGRTASYAEIAASVGVAPGSVGTILARAERAFKTGFLASRGGL